MMEKVEILGVQISNLTSKQLNEEILMLCRRDMKEMILNVNIHAMNIANRHPWFKKALNSAYINFCDGDGVRLGAFLLGERIKEKITYNRWIWDLAKFSSENDLTWYIVGSEKNVIQKANAILSKNYEKLQIVGCHHGFLSNHKVSNNLIYDIIEKKPNVLILGMGMPLQEKWLLEHLDQLDFNVALTGGAVFEYISGETSMTPGMFYRLKLEWLYRFFQDPRRLFVRYFIGNFSFLLRVLVVKFKFVNPQ